MHMGLSQMEATESRRLRITPTIWICTNIEKYAKGQHYNMEKYANTIRVVVTHVSYTELREHSSRIFQYSSILELCQLSSRYSLHNTLVEIRQHIQFAYFSIFVLSSGVRQLSSRYSLCGRRFWLTIRSGELVGERYKAKRKVVLTFLSIFIFFFTWLIQSVSTLKIVTTLFKRQKVLQETLPLLGLPIFGLRCGLSKTLQTLALVTSHAGEYLGFVSILVTCSLLESSSQQHRYT